MLVFQVPSNGLCANANTGRNHKTNHSNFFISVLLVSFGFKRVAAICSTATSPLSTTEDGKSRSSPRKPAPASGQPQQQQQERESVATAGLQTALRFGRPARGSEIIRGSPAAPQKKFGCKPLAWEGSENRT